MECGALRRFGFLALPQHDHSAVDRKALPGHEVRRVAGEEDHHRCHVAVGIAGMKALRDERGLDDPYGYRLKAAVAAVADEIAAAAELVMGKRDGIPAVIVRGCNIEGKEDGSVRELLRPEAEDLFR